MDRHVIVVECAPGDSRPAAARIEKLLKFALRVCALRCIEVRQGGPTNKKQAAAPGKDSDCLQTKGRTDGPT